MPSKFVSRSFVRNEVATQIQALKEDLQADLQRQIQTLQTRTVTPGDLNSAIGAVQDQISNLRDQLKKVEAKLSKLMEFGLRAHAERENGDFWVKGAKIASLNDLVELFKGYLNESDNWERVARDRLIDWIIREDGLIRLANLLHGTYLNGGPGDWSYIQQWARSHRYVHNDQLDPREISLSISIAPEYLRHILRDLLKQANSLEKEVLGQSPISLMILCILSDDLHEQQLDYSTLPAENLQFDCIGRISEQNGVVTVEAGELKSSVRGAPQGEKQLSRRLNLFEQAGRQMMPSWSNSPFLMLGTVYVSLPNNSQTQSQPAIKSQPHPLTKMDIRREYVDDL